MAEIINGNPNAGHQDPVDSGHEIQEQSMAMQVVGKVDRLINIVNPQRASWWHWNPNGGITLDNGSQPLNLRYITCVLDFGDWIAIWDDNMQSWQTWYRDRSWYKAYKIDGNENT